MRPTKCISRRLCVAMLCVLAVQVADLAAGAETACPDTTPAPRRISPDDAIARAINELETINGGFRLRHPSHTATFTADGVCFEPKPGGLLWRWRLSHAGASDCELDGIHGSIEPCRYGSLIRYERGALVEQYVPRKGSVEQQFVIPEPLELGGADLVIEGAVECVGAFEATDNGWLWHTRSAQVSLGDVRVFDAEGRDLTASMTATADRTRIVVNGEALVTAVYPVTIDPEIGTNDFRISDMGTDDDSYSASDSQAAYNSTNDEYLVVWAGRDVNHSEIFGQRIDAATGSEIGTNDFRISDASPDGYTTDPFVTYNPINNEYLVVWSASDGISGLVDKEIFGQLLDGATGQQVGPNDFAISNMGPAGDYHFRANDPRVAFNDVENEYLVVWTADDDTGALVTGEHEIYGQRIDAVTAAELGLDDFRISHMGPDGIEAINALAPEVAFNSLNNEYLVVWYGDPLVNNAYEIFGQLLDGTSGAEVGPDDFRISVSSPQDVPGVFALKPAVVHNPVVNEYFVVWDVQGGDQGGTILGQRLDAETVLELGPVIEVSDTGYTNPRTALAHDSMRNEYVVVWSMSGTMYGQLIDGATGLEIGPDDFQISQCAGPPGKGCIIYAHGPAVAYSSVSHEYLIVWEVECEGNPLPECAQEIFSQRIEAGTGAEIGGDDRVSDMGAEDTAYVAYAPAVAVDNSLDRYLVVWSGDDNTGAVVDGEFEIYGQLIDAFTGEEIGPNDFRISSMGVDGDPTTGRARAPAVAYGGGQYLVVWKGHLNSEFEIYGQLIDAMTGAENGPNDFRISDVGPNGDVTRQAFDPDVAYASATGEFLVVWQGNDLLHYDYEIHAQRIESTGAEVGTNDFILSSMGPAGTPGQNAYHPSVVYNVQDDEYLVVWSGRDGTANSEVFGQRIDAITGTEIGTNDFPISDLGVIGDSMTGAAFPAVAVRGDRYLVVWQGNDGAPLDPQESQIYGQLLDTATGAEVGPNDFRISQMAPDGISDLWARSVEVSADARGLNFLVVWEGGSEADGREIYGQWIEAATGGEIGPDDFRISDMGPDGPGYEAYQPAVASAYFANASLVVWAGNDDTGALAPGEYEIFGQRIDGDCNGNGIPDGDEIAAGSAVDENENGIPDECDDPIIILLSTDVNGDGIVDLLDLIDVLQCFGLPADPPCDSSDVNGDGTVNVLDLIEVLMEFGATSP